MTAKNCYHTFARANGNVVDAEPAGKVAFMCLGDKMIARATWRDIRDGTVLRDGCNVACVARKGERAIGESKDRSTVRRPVSLEHFRDDGHGKASIARPDC